MARPEAETRSERPPFRTAALEYHRRPSEDEGRPLRVTPFWLDRVYRLLMASGIAACALVAMVPAGEYASGPAVVRLAARSEVTAETTGIVGEILVAPGERVGAGQILARLEGSRQQAELDKLRRQFELLLVDRLREPRVGSRPGLGAAHEEMRLAERSLQRLELRAPHAGVVGDVLLREGKAVEPGQLAFTVLSTSTRGEPTVIALLPGRYRPLLQVGMPMQIRWSGHRGARQELTIEHVSAGVVGPSEVRTIVGPLATGFGETAGFALVQARLPATQFEASGRLYEVSDGLPGIAEVPVRRRRLGSLLLPWTEDPLESR